MQPVKQYFYDVREGRVKPDSFAWTLLRKGAHMYAKGWQDTTSPVLVWSLDDTQFVAALHVWGEQVVCQPRVWRACHRSGVRAITRDHDGRMMHYLEYPIDAQVYDQLASHHEMQWDDASVNWTRSNEYNWEEIRVLLGERDGETWLNTTATVWGQPLLANWRISASLPEVVARGEVALTGDEHQKAHLLSEKVRGRCPLRLWDTAIGMLAIEHLTDGNSVTSTQVEWIQVEPTYAEGRLLIGSR